MVRVVLLLATSSSFGLCQFIPLLMDRGVPEALIEVEGATNNPQRIIIDTGSIHTYILSHQMIDNLPRAAGRHANSIRGYRGSLIADNMVSQADASHEDYVGYDGLRLVRWTRKQFRLGNRVWNQKFAVAELPQTMIERAHPDKNGLIGAEPLARFTRDNPIFGFKPNVTDPNFISMFFEPIRPEWCRNNNLYYAPISHPSGWYVWGKVETISNDPTTRPDFVLTHRFELLIDSGTNLVTLPPALFQAYIDHLRSIIPSLNTTTTLIELSMTDLHLIPPFRITLSNNGPTLVIPVEKLFKCWPTRPPWPPLCVIQVKEKRINHHDIIIGEPLFQSFITVFNSQTRTIGFCEPVESTFAEPLFIPAPPRVPPPKPLLPKQQSIVPIPFRKKSIFDVPSRTLEEMPDKPMVSPLRLPDDIIEEPLPGDMEDENRGKQQEDKKEYERKDQKKAVKRVFDGGHNFAQLIFICIIFII